MNVRVKSFLFSLLLIGVAAAAYAQASTAVQIEALAIEGTTLTITGRNFGSGVPTVMVGETNASVSSNSDTEIVAVTQQLEAGIHLLKVVRDTNEGGTGVSTLQIR